jgi:hypothetical protein
VFSQQSPVRKSGELVTLDTRTRMAIDRKLLGIYLNDHLAGSTVGRNLSQRTLGNNRGTPYEAPLERLAGQIAEDRQTLLDLMRRLEVREDRLKSAAALVGERAGRLKPNGRLTGYSPLSRVVEFEALTLGVTAKRAMWRALRDLDAPELAEFDFAALEARADSQQQLLEEQRAAAARDAFADGGDR